MRRSTRPAACRSDLHPIRPFYKQRGCRLTDLALRPAYDREILDRIAPYSPDIILLSSYLYILTEPFLAAYPGRIVNVHGSDLTRLGLDGRPLYPGLRAVRDAIEPASARRLRRRTSSPRTSTRGPLSRGPIPTPSPRLSPSSLRAARPAPFMPTRTRTRSGCSRRPGARC